MFHSALFTHGEIRGRGPLSGSYDALGPVLATAHQGVYVFFVLSGYLIARPWIRSFVDGAAAPDTGAYVRNRLLRIVPLFWAVVAAVALVHGLRGTSLQELLAILAFAQVLDGSPLANRIGHAWTLNAEMAFYLAVPLVALAVAPLRSRLNRAGRIWVVAGLAAGLAAGSLLWRGAGEADVTRVHVPWLLVASFVPGVLLALVDVATSRRRLPLPPLAIVVAGIALLALEQRVTDANPGWRLALTAVGAGAVVGGALAQEWWRGRTWGVMRHRLLDWLGARSYGIYLISVPVQLELLPALPDRSWAAFVTMLLAGTAITIALSDLAYRFIERPALAHRAPTRRPSSADVQPATGA